MDLSRAEVSQDLSGPSHGLLVKINAQECKLDSWLIVKSLHLAIAEAGPVITNEVSASASCIGLRIGRLLDYRKDSGSGIIATMGPSFCKVSG